MPLSGVTPLSLGEYGAAGAATGAPGAASGIENLASTFAQGPLLAARGQYFGAQTGHLQAETGEINQRQQDWSNAQALMQKPRWWEDEGAVRQIGAYLQRYPDAPKNLAQGIAVQAQAAQLRGGGSPQLQALADTFSGGTGVAPMGNTATGFNADLANRVQQAQVAAGPHYAQVREMGREYDQKMLPAILGGVPGMYSQRDLSNAAPGSVQFFSETAAAENQKAGPVLLPGGQGTGFAPPTTPGVRPIPSSDQMLGAGMAGFGWGGRDAFALPGPTDQTLPPPASTAGTVPGTTTVTPPSSTNAATGGLSNAEIVAAAWRNKLQMQNVIPSPPANTPEQQAKNEKTLTDSLAKNLITPDMRTGLGSLSPGELQVDPQARNAIMQRAQELAHSRDPLFQNQPEAAIERAVQELIPNLTLDKQHTNFFGKPTIRWTPTQPPPGTPGNPINPPPMGPQPTQPQRPGPTVANAAQQPPQQPNVPAVYGQPQPVPQMPPGWQPGQSTEPYSAPTPFIYRKAGEILTNRPDPGAVAPTEADVLKRFGGQPGGGPPRPGAGPAPATQAQFEAAWRAAHPQAAQPQATAQATPQEGQTSPGQNGTMFVFHNGMWMKQQ